MRISAVTLRAVGRLRDATFELAPGLTIVRGPNEAGKSTLRQAIEAGLTGTAADGDTALRAWDAGPSASPGVELAFSWEDEDLGVHEGLISRRLGAPGAARLELDGAVVEDDARIANELAGITGIPSAGFLRRTASVHHRELDGLADDDAALGDRLRSSISGADVSSRAARRRLAAALASLQGSAASPGRLKVAEDAVADSAARLAHAEDGLARLGQDRGTHDQAKARLADAQRSLADRRVMLGKAREAEELTAKRTTAHERYDRYKEAVVLRDEIADLDGRHPSAIPLAVLRTGVDRLRSLDTRIADLEQELAGEVRVDFEVGPEVAWRPLSRTSLVLVVLGVLVALGGFALGSLGFDWAWPAAAVIGGIIAAAGLVLAIVGYLRHRSNRMDRQLRDVEIDRRLRGRSEMEAELRHCRTDRDAALADLKVAETSTAEEQLAAEEAHVAQIDQRRTRLAELIAGEPREGLDLKRDAAALEVEQCTTALEALGPIAKEPNARQRLEAEVADAEATLDRARNEEAAARARVEQNPADAEEIAGLSERLAVWKAQLASLRRRERIWSRTLAELDAAEQGTVDRATRFLERRMGVDIAVITAGRYRRIRIGDEDMAMEVFAPERGDWIPVSSLSRGTLDAVYMAARVALVRFLTGGRRPPLLLDDPFVTLDADRAARALGLLRDVAADTQVIYFTTSDRYDELADRVVVLDGPTELDPGETAPG